MCVYSENSNKNRKDAHAIFYHHEKFRCSGNLYKIEKKVKYGSEE